MPFKAGIQFSFRLPGELVRLRTALGQGGVNRLAVRTIARANRDLQTLYRKKLRIAIRQTTRRRTGALLKLRSKSRLRANSIDLLPNFPFTKYNTPRSRGRPNASKQGQYAFVVNRRKQFIQLADKLLTEDRPAIHRILGKHWNFIINSILRKS